MDLVLGRKTLVIKMPSFDEKIIYQKILNCKEMNQNNFILLKHSLE